MGQEYIFRSKVVILQLKIVILTGVKPKMVGVLIYSVATK